MAAPGRIERFIALYALAWAGGSIAYTPFLTLLLPERIAALAGPDRAVDWLSALAFCGAITASIGHILFGYASDITRNRRGWIALGLVLSCALLALFPWVTSFTALLVLIAAWQLALNMMLAPLAALAGDVVPDGNKGLLGGFLAFAPAVGAASGALVTWPGLASAEMRPATVAAMVAVCVVPVIILAPRGRPADEAQHKSGAQGEPRGRVVVARMWLARLALQVAEAALFAFLYLWFRAIDPSLGANRTALIFGAVLAVSAPLGLAVGRWGDRHDRPLKPLVYCAAVSALALAAMALAKDTAGAIVAYAMFGMASSIFLALHSAQTLRILPRPERRGRDLGLFNLTNTAPSMIMPALALMLVPAFGYSGLFFLLAALAALSAALVPARLSK
ncbi:MFS transporter [Tsuneonella sp. HG249]